MIHEGKLMTRALDPCATSEVAIDFSPLFTDQIFFRKAQSIALSKKHLNPPVLAPEKAPYKSHILGDFKVFQKKVPL